MAHARTIYGFVILLALLGAASFGFGAAPAGPSPVTLRQCYEWAKARNEDLKIRQEDIVQSKARARAALGGAYPSVDWKWTDTWQDPKGVDKLESRGFSGFVEKSQIDSRFSVNQPIFSGLREFSAYKGFKRESAKNALLLERADKELFARTADVFYTVVLHETDRENTEASLRLAQDRVKDLGRFKRLGKARDSEVFTAEAHAAALKARLQQIQSRLGSAREELSYLTGQDLSTLPILDEIPNPPDVSDLDAFLVQGKNRTDLQAQREDVAARRLRIRYEKGSYWPSVDVTGNYYTQRATFLEDIQWDVILALEVPLFQGGAVSARVKEATAAYRQSILTLQAMEREVYHSIRQTHGELLAAMRETQSLEEASAAAQKSYDALLDEYKLGLVTNLDVLQALDLLQAQNSARDAARVNMKMLFIRLNVTVEKMAS